MLQKKSFVKKTRGGKVVKVWKCLFVSTYACTLVVDHHQRLLAMQVVREHYLRDDIW